MVDNLEIAFETRSLRNLCEQEARAKAEFDAPVADYLKRRLADMRAAATVLDLPAGRLQEVTELGVQAMAVDLKEDFQLIFCSNHPNQPTTEIGRVDWAKVSRIKILRIGKDDDALPGVPA